jgi:gas vesicle protein
MKEKILQFMAVVIALLGVVAFCLVATDIKILSIDALPPSFIGALLGAVISGIITVVLLIGQSSAEEVKERNVKVFEKKSEIFQDYINNLRDIWEDQKITQEDLKTLIDKFRIELMVYLKKKPVNAIAEYLDKLGDCSFEKTPNLDILNENIFAIINILSKDLGFAGKIDKKVNKRLDDKINKYPREFREVILIELNNALLNMKRKVLKEGRYERLDDGGEYACFNFTNSKYAGCKIIIGSFSQYCAHGGVYLGLYVEKDIHQVDEFRFNDDEESNFPEFSKYWIGIFDTKGRKDWVELTTKIPEEEINQNIGEFKPLGDNCWLFLDRPSYIKDYRDNFRHVAHIIGQRAVWWFEHGEIRVGEKTLSIMDFLDKYLGNRNV